jgi:RND family efflux transporter MFP subunit
MTATQREARRGKETMVMGALRADEGVEEQAGPGWGRTATFWAAGAVVVLLGLGAAWQIKARSEGGYETLPGEALPVVKLVRAEKAPGSEVSLPATLRADQATDLYPRVSGFVKSWKADIGARVKAGQLLAEIDTPELDQQVRQAEAQVTQAAADLAQSKAEWEEAKSEVVVGEANLIRAQANYVFAVSQIDRVRQVLKQGASTQEELDRTVSERDARSAERKAARSDLARRKTAVGTREAVTRSREASLATARANLKRLRELQAFQRIVAPFDGVVSVRNAEVGTLVSAGNASNPRPLFRVVQGDVLRAQLPVPQAYADGIREGDVAGVTVPERPGKTYRARVARTASEIDPGSRTVLVELELPNKAGELLPGTYAQVNVSGGAAKGAVLVPASAVLMRPEGPRVALVSGGQIHLRAVDLGRDHGSKTEILIGLSADEQVVVNPTGALEEGARVAVEAGR